MGAEGRSFCSDLRDTGKVCRMSVRLATENDLDQIAALTTAYRQRLDRWAPAWWRKSSTADHAHPGWLAHMLRSPQFTFRVVEVDGVVEGCAVSVPRWLNGSSMTSR